MVVSGEIFDILLILLAFCHQAVFRYFARRIASKIGSCLLSCTPKQSHETRERRCEEERASVVGHRVWPRVAPLQGKSTTSTPLLHPHRSIHYHTTLISPKFGCWNADNELICTSPRECKLNWPSSCRHMTMSRCSHLLVLHTIASTHRTNLVVKNVCRLVEVPLYLCTDETKQFNKQHNIYSNYINPHSERENGSGGGGGSSGKFWQHASHASSNNCAHITFLVANVLMVQCSPMKLRIFSASLIAIIYYMVSRGQFL